MGALSEGNGQNFHVRSVLNILRSNLRRLGYAVGHPAESEVQTELVLCRMVPRNFSLMHFPFKNSHREILRLC